MTRLTDDIKSALRFYDALGFERLPIRFERVNVKPDRSRSSVSAVSSTPHNRDAGASIRKTGEGREIKEAALKDVKEVIGDCRRCKLSSKRTHIVFGEGNPDARLMFVGEAPGREEDLQARPFVGEAGMLLTKLIEKMGFSREDVYIANIVKCRPPMNRDPEGDEMDACKGFVEKQIEIIGPEVIMSLGRISSLTLIGNPNLKISAIRGRFFDYRGIPLMPTFHPAYLMRNPKDKWLTWSDAQKVLDRLEKNV